MKLNVETINHVGLVVKDKEAAERFYVGILGLEPVPGRPWYRLNAANAIHLIPFGTGEAEHQHHHFRHVALQVVGLRAVLQLLLDNERRVFQTGFDGAEKVITDRDDPLEFGTGSLFVNDPDANLIEFLQLGRGVFA